MRITVGGFNFDNAFTDLEDRHVKRTAAKVEHCDGLVFLLIETVRERSRCRLVHDTHNFQTCDLAGIFRRLALRVVEVSGNRDDGLIDFLTEIIFGRLFHFLQNDRRDFGRAPFFAAGANTDVAVARALHLVRDLFDFFANFVIATSHKSLD